MAKDTSGQRSTKDRFGWSSFATHLSSFGVLTLCLGVLAGATLGLRPLEARAAATTSRGAPSVSIQWPRIPGKENATWMARDEQEHLLTIARNAASDDDEPFTPITLERVSRALAASGWFNGYPVARRVSIGTIEVLGEWRVPAAVVRTGDKDHLISWNATPLPPAYATGASPYPVILNAAKGPPTNASGARTFDSSWQGEDVGAALELIGTIMDQAWFPQVAGVDVSQYGPDRTLVLMTKAGTRVVWGGRASKPRPGEVSTSDKLARLTQLFRDTKRIDGGFPLVILHTLNIQFDRTATAHRHADDPTPPAP